MRQGIVGTALAAIATFGGATVSAQGDPTAVRPEDAAIRELVTNGLARSATFRDLTTQLDRSDVVVYIRFSRCAGKVAACLAWGSAGAGARRRRAAATVTRDQDAGPAAGVTMIGTNCG